MENCDSPKRTLNSNAAIEYISYNEHHEFMNELENELISICAQDAILKDTIPLLEASTIDCQFNEEICQLLRLKVDSMHGGAIHLNVKFLDGQSCDIYLSSNASLMELQRSLERCTEIRLQKKCKEEGCQSKVINWKHIWRKYDLMVDGKQRICLHNEPRQETTPGSIGLDCQLSDSIIENHSTVEFVPRRT